MAILQDALFAASRFIIWSAEDSSSPAGPSPSPPPSQAGQDNSSHNNESEGGNQEKESSSLVVFVVLGVGVAVSGLGAIVGAKHCFRNRARIVNEDEPIRLEGMRRPHRRRCEKKLMTMDEVNEKFAIVKYKAWVIERAKEGLPTAGGISVLASRANSSDDADGVAGVIATEERHTTDDTHEANATADGVMSRDTQPAPEEKDPMPSGSTKRAETTMETATTSTANPMRLTTDLQQALPKGDLNDDDEDNINSALSPEMLAAPGDACAICIDTLEDDEDVRGLTCGHAFHAVCIDPWLTRRRACCPLCKADYFTPKPSPNQEDDSAGQQSAGLDPQENTRLNMPASLNTVWFRNARAITGTRTLPAAGGLSSTCNDRRSGVGEANQNQQTETPETAGTTAGMMSSVRRAFRARPDAPSSTRTARQEVTPTQLEAGTLQ